jgi:hypothetical protein
MPVGEAFANDVLTDGQVVGQSEIALRRRQAYQGSFTSPTNTIWCDFIENEGVPDG